MGALQMGLKEEELPEIIDSWREANPKIVQYWWDVEKAAMTAYKTGERSEIGKIAFEFWSGTLWMVLPSGRRLAYFNQLIENHPDWNAVGVYSDYGISGTSSDKRTGFKRLMRHCGEGKIDRVVCKSISRFARNTTDFMTALRTLRENNTTILFEKENLDTADPTSEFILTTLGAIAQEENRSISGNITLGNKMRFKRGDVRNEVIYG